MVAYSPTNPRLTRYQRDRNTVARGSLTVQHWETVVELDSGARIAPWLLLRPNLQYINQPGGTGDRGDALVVGLYTQIIF
jgi:porin